MSPLNLRLNDLADSFAFLVFSLELCVAGTEGIAVAAVAVTAMVTRIKVAVE